MGSRLTPYSDPPIDWDKVSRISRNVVGCAVLGALACLLVYACVFVHTLTVVTASLPVTLDKAVAREATLTRAAVAAQITPVVAKLDGQVSSLQTNLFSRVDKIEGDANQQIANLQDHTITQLTDIRTAAVTQIEGTRKELVGQLNNVTVPAGDVIAGAKALLPATQVAIANAGNLVKDAQDSLDDSYRDINNLIQSAVMASTQTAYTMETVRTQAPVLIGHVSGIAGDFHDATHSLDQKYFHPPPMNKKQKVVAFFSNFEALLIAALRGGVF